MSTTAALGPFILVLTVSGKPEKYFYCYDGAITVNGHPKSQPQFTTSRHDARFKQFNSAAGAVAMRDQLRALYPKCSITIESTHGDGEALFGDRYDNISTARSPAAEERVNHHVLVGDADVLIVPGTPRGYYIRFPGSAFESIYGDTPDAVAELYRQQVTLRPELANFAERYIPPAPPEPQSPQPPRIGRMRPGSLR